MAFGQVTPSAFDDTDDKINRFMMRWSGESLIGILGINKDEGIVTVNNPGSHNRTVGAYNLDGRLIASYDVGSTRKFGDNKFIYVAKEIGETFNLEVIRTDGTIIESWGGFPSFVSRVVAGVNLEEDLLVTIYSNSGTRYYEVFNSSGVLVHQGNFDYASASGRAYFVLNIRTDRIRNIDNSFYVNTYDSANINVRSTIFFDKSDGYKTTKIQFGRIVELI